MHYLELSPDKTVWYYTKTGKHFHGRTFEANGVIIYATEHALYKYNSLKDTVDSFEPASTPLSLDANRFSLRKPTV